VPQETTFPLPVCRELFIRILRAAARAFDCRIRRSIFVLALYVPLSNSVMKFGVIVFPGSNCDHDAYHVAKHVFG
jgi:hypothetical protein